MRWIDLNLQEGTKYLRNVKVKFKRRVLPGLKDLNSKYALQKKKSEAL